MSLAALIQEEKPEHGAYHSRVIHSETLEWSNLWIVSAQLIEEVDLTPEELALCSPGLMTHSGNGKSYRLLSLAINKDEKFGFLEPGVWYEPQYEDKRKNWFRPLRGEGGFLEPRNGGQRFVKL